MQIVIGKSITSNNVGSNPATPTNMFLGDGMINRRVFVTEKQIKYCYPCLYKTWISSLYYPHPHDTIDAIYKKLVLLCEQYNIQMPHCDDVVNKSLERIEKELEERITLMKEFDKVKYKDGKVTIYFKTGKHTSQFLEFPQNQLDKILKELSRIREVVISSGS